LASGALVCSRCHALVYAEKLDQLSKGARLLEEHGQTPEARQQWLAALELLPPNATQAEWVHDHIKKLQLLPVTATPSNAARARWGRLAPLGPLLIALSKGKALLALLNLKFILSFAAFFGIYWSLYGMWFGLGFTVQILIHELGHYIDIKRRGLPADVPVFLPGMGAYVRWQALGVPVETRAAVSLAGPLAGWIAAATCAVLWYITGSKVWAALAHSGAWLNLLNLIPVWGLDGGHAFLALTKAQRGFLVAYSVLLLAIARDNVFLLIALGATWRLFTKDFPERPSIVTGGYFAGVLSALAALMWFLPQ
jgi:Zn-dependent protease